MESLHSQGVIDDFAGLELDRVQRYARDLPHWRQDGAIYFVTFRLVDSIPRQVMEIWQHDRRTWLASHGITDNLSAAERTRRYSAIRPELFRAFQRDQARRYFLELDECHGGCALRDAEASTLVADAMTHYSGTRIRCGDFVVMPNHVHWLVQPLEGHDLETILASIKRWSARRVNGLRNRSGPLWQRESFDHIVRNEEQYRRIRSYIEENPRKARLKHGQYRYHPQDL